MTDIHFPEQTPLLPPAGDPARLGPATLDPATLDFAKAGGLLPCAVQDADTAQVLMLGHMNQAALERTLHSGLVTFRSAALASGHLRCTPWVSWSARYTAAGKRTRRAATPPSCCRVNRAAPRRTEGGLGRGRGGPGRCGPG